MNDIFDEIADLFAAAAFSEQGTIQLNNEYDGETFYSELRNADHWEAEGYEPRVANIYYDDGEIDADATTTDRPEEVDHYHVQFADLQDKKTWIHIDVPGGTADEVTYGVTMGDPETAAKDLGYALQDVQDSLE